MSWTNKKSPKITKQRKGDRYHRQEQEVGSLKDYTRPQIPQPTSQWLINNIQICESTSFRPLGLDVDFPTWGLYVWEHVVVESRPCWENFHQVL